MSKDYSSDPIDSESDYSDYRQDYKKRNVDQLNLLSVFHFVMAGVSLLFSCFPLIYVVLGIALLNEKLPKKDGPPPEFIAWFFIAIGGIGFLLFLLYVVGLTIAGFKLRRQKSYIFCLVMAILSCLNMPFGTILGIFTIIILMRPETQVLFGRNVRRSG